MQIYGVSGPLWVKAKLLGQTLFGVRWTESGRLDTEDITTKWSGGISQTKLDGLGLGHAFNE
jgi:hypothetical protein